MRIVDSHTHIGTGQVERLPEVGRRYGAERFCTLSIPCYRTALNNLECLLVKKVAPGQAYVYGGITYVPEIEPTAEDVEKELQLRRLEAAGNQALGISSAPAAAGRTGV